MKIIENTKRCLMLLFLVTAITLLAGCGDDNENFNAKIKVADATGIITGKVVDAATLVPIKSAKVVLFVNGTKAETRSSSSTDADLTGTFVFGGIPAGTHAIRFEAVDYANTERSVTVPQSNDNTPITVGPITVSLAKGFDLTVVASDAGAPVAGVTVVAASNNGPLQSTGVTAADGTVILTGLDLTDTYTVFSSPVYDAAGTAIKYVTSGNVAFDPAGGERTVPIALQAATRTDNIAIVATNLLSDGTLAGVRKLTTRNGVIRVVFNYPVELSGGVTASFLNDLIAVPDTAPTQLATVSAALDATRTVLTITNSTDYLINETYTFNGSVTARVSGVTKSLSLATIGDVTIVNDTATGLSSTTVFTADNYNGTYEGGVGVNAPTATASQVYVNFPEYVYGTYRVISTTTGATTTAVNGATVSFGNPLEVFSANSGGKDAIVAFRQDLVGISLADDVSTAPATRSQVTLFLDVYDAEGNSFTGNVTLNVQ